MISQSFPAEPVLFFSPPKFSGGIGCRHFLGSQPGRVLLYFQCEGFALRRIRAVVQRWVDALRQFPDLVARWCFVKPTKIGLKCESRSSQVDVIKRASDVAEGFGADMGVDLGNLTAGVPKQGLNIAELLHFTNPSNLQLNNLDTPQPLPDNSIPEPSGHCAQRVSFVAVNALLVVGLRP